MTIPVWSSSISYTYGVIVSYYSLVSKPALWVYNNSSTASSVGSPPSISSGWVYSQSPNQGITSLVSDGVSGTTVSLASNVATVSQAKITSGFLNTTTNILISSSTNTQLFYLNVRLGIIGSLITGTIDFLLSAPSYPTTVPTTVSGSTSQYSVYWNTNTGFAGADGGVASRFSVPIGYILTSPTIFTVPYHIPLGSNIYGEGVNNTLQIGISNSIPISIAPLTIVILPSTTTILFLN